MNGKEKNCINIIVDGYNLIGVHHNDMKSRREWLTEKLIEYRKQRKHEIILVFDGWKNGQGRETRTVTGGITVIYSGLGERADNVINRIIARREKKWVVVSSDREIMNAAWKFSCVPIGSEDFCDSLEGAMREKKNESYDEDVLRYDEERMYSSRVKGNPRQLSRKQKSIRRVLEKL